MFAVHQSRQNTKSTQNNEMVKNSKLSAISLKGEYCESNQYLIWCRDAVGQETKTVGRRLAAKTH